MSSWCCIRKSLTGTDILLIPLDAIVVVEILEVVEFLITHLPCGVYECVLCISAAVSSLGDIYFKKVLVCRRLRCSEMHTRTAVSMVLLLAISMIRLELQRVSLRPRQVFVAVLCSRMELTHPHSIPWSSKSRSLIAAHGYTPSN